MKVQRWYDVRCDVCFRYLSTDFAVGMQPTRDFAEKEARRCGFKTKDGKIVCPICQETEKGGAE